MPMQCVWMDMPDGSRALVRMQVKRLTCSTCGSEGKFLCDFPTEIAGTRKTCDQGMCLRHATRVSSNTDYCPGHAELAEAVRGG